MTPTSTIGAAELRYLASAPDEPASWLVVIAPEERIDAAIGRASGAVIGANGSTFDVSIGLLVLVQRHPALPGTLLLFGFEMLGDDDWRHLDSLRSGLARERPIVLVMTDASAGKLARLAPNLASWIGGGYAAWDDEAELLSADEREARIDVLRGWFQMTDEQIVQAATEHRLAREPELSEWLVLLGRGDLLERE